MYGQVERSHEIKKRKNSALVYTVLGLGWALLALYSVNQAFKTLVVLGTAVPVLLLIARLVRVQRESMDVPSLWEPNKTVSRAAADKRILVLTMGIFTAMLVVTLFLWTLGKSSWIVPGAATVFTVHFYLLPPAYSIWEDLLLATAAAVAAIITPFWFPEQTWIWTLVASSACALACWLAADLRYQRVQLLQEEENRETDPEAFS
jgi:hypothetical protein